MKTHDLHLLGSQEGATLEMSITDEMKRVLAEGLNLEVEMLQGFTGKLPDGRSHYVLHVPPEKCPLVMEFMLKCISHSHLQNGN